MDYLIVKWLHIVSASILAGLGFGTAYFKWMADRNGNVTTISSVAHMVVRADWIFTTPSGFIQLASGLWLARLGNYPLHQGWLAYSITLFVVAGLCWLPVVVLQYRMRALADQAVGTGRPLGQLYWRYARIWTWLGIPAFTAMLVIYALMVIKPVV